MINTSAFIRSTGDIQKEFQTTGLKATLAAGGGIIFVLFSAIVLFSSCLCLAIPGVNVIRSVILPGAVPSTVGFLLSIPLFYYAYTLSKKRMPLRQQLATECRQYLEKNLDAVPKKGDDVKEYHNALKNYFDNEIFVKHPSRAARFLYDTWVYKTDLLKAVKELPPKDDKSELSKLLDATTIAYMPGKAKAKAA